MQIFSLDIDEIPENIRHCRSLQSLDFSGNPLANKYGIFQF
jgi:Leucine-rich repeat (LRR) protein